MCNQCQSNTVGGFFSLVFLMSPLRLGRRDEQGCLFALQVSGDLKTQKCSVSLLDKFLAAGYCRPLCKMFYIGSKIGDPPTSSGK